ncbi:hypothetical protein TNCV_2330851 [Trichonephila clavipes]|nr:hypothetical protein TNCV_2330851 [Trichonephila clavipes]
MLPVLGKKAALEWCMKEGLIGSSYVCPKCGKRNWSHLEVQAVIRFLGAKNVSASDILYQIVEVYGEEAMSRQHVENGLTAFNQADRMSITVIRPGAAGQVLHGTNSRNDLK